MNPRLPIAVLAGAATLLLAACSSGATTTPAAAAGDKIAVVASTDVYGSIVAAVGGDRVEVRSLIDGPNADPHEYESTPADAAAVARATLVVVNGGGYDDFATKIVDSTGTKPVVIDAVALSGLRKPGETEFNEHVWYDLGTVRTVAAEIAKDLAAASPADAATFTANAQRFGTDLDGLQQKIAAIKAAHDGQRIAVTEPVPLYLTEAAGLQNVTPEAFSEAVEEGNDPPAAVLAQTLAIFPGVKALVANSQTESPSTTQVENAAKAAGVPVVAVSETLPAGVTSYVAWQSAQLDALAGALNSAA
ncbi:zinc ABC transporter substrate-binding protein [Pseudonocardia ailaonensis]|uniref:Zinc ABC transporter substrate-binding protein n=1 Tax=Pseudonocardia ailaonensis TaxID=367279 RepID=A0ABN2MWF1_9PSEU